jgi:predicted GNAT superfamily acetyltransferase
MKNWEKIKNIKGKDFLFAVEDSFKETDYLKYEELRNQIWGEPLDNLASVRNMKSENYFVNGSCLFIGVFVRSTSGEFVRDKNHLVGFSYGYTGVKDVKLGFKSLNNLSFYSQFTGVISEYHKYGLGILIKEFQKELVRDLFGIKVITCTYDPLTGINAYRNIHYFKMELIQYRESCYGDFEGNLNRADIPSDRFFIAWNLDKPPARLQYDIQDLLVSGQIALEAEAVDIQGSSHPVVLEKVKKIDLDLREDILLVEIPVDFYLMLRETNVQDETIRKIPYDWRIRSREVFLALLDKGYKLRDFRVVEYADRKRDFYVFSR